MPEPKLNIVTGALSFSGKYIAEKILEKGEQVRTLTAHPNRPNPFQNKIEVLSYRFDLREELIKSFIDAKVFYNTYWVRFPYRKIGYEQAVKNTKKLISSAKQAGVKRIVHISITNPSLDSPFPYFQGKAQVEQAIIESGLSYAIIRPTLVFGVEDILVNNIAWLLKKFPVFAIPGIGDYKVQPIFVEDLAEIAIHAGEKNNNLILDAVGPEIFSFAQMVRLIAETIKSKALIFHLPTELFILIAKVLSPIVRDVILTRDEVYGLLAGLLVSKESPLGKTKFSDWLTENANQLGIRYASELKRHYTV